MIQTHNVEKKIPLTVLESKVEAKSYQFVVESDSPLGDCLIALGQITNHIQELKTKLEAEHPEEVEQNIES